MEDTLNGIFRLDCSPPRRVNAQAVILRKPANDDTGNGDRESSIEVLLQLRSMRMAVMPGHLGAIGGCHSPCDRDSRATVLREVQEESGLRSGIVLPPAKFAQGEKCDWYVMQVHEPTFDEQASTQLECGDMTTVLPQLPACTTLAECFGHAWVPVEDLAAIAPTLQLMGGLVARVRGAVAHLQALEKKISGQYLLHADVLSSLAASGIQINPEGVVVACPTEWVVGSAEASSRPTADIGSLRSQIEYYLSDDNLRHDQFFHGKISADSEGWLEMQFIMGCKRVQAMLATPENVVEALQGSAVEVRADGLAIRRANNAALPVFVGPRSSSGGKGGRARHSRGRGTSAKDRGRGKATDVASSAPVASDPAATDTAAHQDLLDAHIAVEPEASAVPETHLAFTHNSA